MGQVRLATKRGAEDLLPTATTYLSSVGEWRLAMRTSSIPKFVQGAASDVAKYCGNGSQDTPLVVYSDIHVLSNIQDSVKLVARTGTQARG